MDARILPGADHSSYRGEAWAIPLALQQVWAPMFYTDCSAVVTLLESMLCARRMGFSVKACKHWDIWESIWVHILQRPPNTVSIVKISSHTRWQLESDPHLVWVGRWNDQVDSIAKRVLLVDHKETLDALSAFARDEERQSALLHDFHTFWIQATGRAMAKGSQAPVSNVPDFTTFYPSHGQVLPFAPFMTEDGLQMPFGRTFTCRFIRWFRDIPWIGESTADSGTSLLEFYISFALATQIQCTFGH